MKALVGGANGYLGRHLVQKLLANNFEVIPCGRQTGSIDDHESYRQVDFANKAEVAALDLDIDFIFFFIGKTGTADGFDSYEAYIESNEIALLNLLDHHRKTGSRARVVFPSSRLIFQGQKDQFLEEEDKKEAKTVYAQNKLACENYLKMYHNRFQIPYTVFRICVPYGNNFDGAYSYGTLGFFLGKATKGEAITLYGDGSQRRTFSHVEDIGEAMLTALKHSDSVNQTFNIGGGDHCSLRDAAAMVAQKFGVEVVNVKWPDEALLLESGDTIFSDYKLSQMCSWHPQHSLSSWLGSL